MPIGSKGAACAARVSGMHYISLSQSKKYLTSQHHAPHVVQVATQASCYRRIRESHANGQWNKRVWVSLSHELMWKVEQMNNLKGQMFKPKQYSFWHQITQFTWKRKLGNVKILPKIWSRWSVVVNSQRFGFIRQNGSMITSLQGLFSDFMLVTNRLGAAIKQTWLVISDNWFQAIHKQRVDWLQCVCSVEWCFLIWARHTVSQSWVSKGHINTSYKKIHCICFGIPWTNFLLLWCMCSQREVGACSLLLMMQRQFYLFHTELQCVIFSPQI